MAQKWAEPFSCEATSSAPEEKNLRLEKEAVSQRGFREQGLRLYCGVHARDMEPQTGTARPPSGCGEDCGLVMGYQAEKDGSVRAQPCWSRRIRRFVEELLTKRH